MHTNVNVRLRSLESGREAPGSQSLVCEDMVNGVGGARPQQRGSAAPQEEVDGSGDARHPDCPSMTGGVNGRKEKGWMRRCLQAVWASPSSSIQNFRIPVLVSKVPGAANGNTRFAESRRARYALMRLARPTEEDGLVAGR